jgi:uncharacterized protein (DUF433 family)
MIGRRMIAAGVVAAAVAVGGVAGAVIGIPGLSSASSSASLSSSSGGSGGSGGNGGHAGSHFHARASFAPGLGANKDLLDAAAKALHLSTSQLLQKLSDGKTTIADVAKDQKVDVQTVIDAMDAVAKSDISNLVNNPLPTFGHFHAKGTFGGSGGSGAVGPGGFAGPAVGGFGFGFRGAMGGSIDAVAKALGISTKDLLGDLRNGQSIADIAKSKNVDVNQLITTLVTDAKAQIAAAAKAGHIPQALATKLEQNLQQLITDVVNNTHPKGAGRFGGFGHGGGGRGGPGGFRGPGGEAPMPAPPAPTS